MTEITLGEIVQLTGTLSLQAVLLFLLITERRSHDETRRTYRIDMLQLIGELQSILREVAGIRANMLRNLTEPQTKPIRQEETD